MVVPQHISPSNDNEENNRQPLNKGYAEVQYEYEIDAIEAVENMNGYEVLDRPLKVKLMGKPTIASLPSDPSFEIDEQQDKLESLDMKKPIWNQS